MAQNLLGKGKLVEKVEPTNKSRFAKNYVRILPLAFIGAAFALALYGWAGDEKNGILLAMPGIFIILVGGIVSWMVLRNTFARTLQPFYIYSNGLLSYSGSAWKPSAKEFIPAKQVSGISVIAFKDDAFLVIILKDGKRKGFAGRSPEVAKAAAEKMQQLWSIKLEEEP